MGVGSSNNMEEKRNEAIIYNSPLIQIPDTVITVTKSLCKILARNKVSSGFLIKLFKGDEDFFCLMTNEHVITKDLIKNKEKIKFYYDNESKSKEIYLNNDERFIKEFTDNGLDITVVEILSKDKIDEGYFLLPCIDYMFNYKGLINKEITIIQYPGGKLSYSNGRIKEIEKYEITHLASTEPGSSGSPIFLKDTIKVTGIHKSGNKDNSENYADLIGPIFNFFSNFKKEKDKIVYKNGNYYIGEFKNGLRHGKGIEYYKNGNIQYDGDFINDKFEGNGKYIYEDGEYYIGEFKNGLRHGKGTQYYKNGNIKYDGYFINGKPKNN